MDTDSALGNIDQTEEQCTHENIVDIISSDDEVMHNQKIDTAIDDYMVQTKLSSWIQMHWQKSLKKLNRR